MKPYLCVWISFLSVVFAVSAKSADPVIDTAFGPVVGRVEDGVEVYRGVPFAAAPIGVLRWAPPMPPAPWSSVRDAGAFGPACIQPKSPHPGRDVGPQSEDCLSLNVWAPEGAEKAPVMVWIHGGAFRVGAASIPFYDGAAFARSGVVLVSINYRLGAFGFLANDAVRKANGGDAANFGLLDQIAALSWVRQNIGAFGGDPDNVTIFGESAGGASALYHLTSDKTKGLFQKVIVQSGGGQQNALCAWQSCGGRPAAQDRSDEMIAALGASAGSIEALRALSHEQVMALAPLSQGMGFGPMIDDDSVTGNIYERILAGDAAQTPLIIGSNSYEASLMRSFRLSPQQVFRSIGDGLERAKKAYNVEARGLSDEDFAAELFRDALFGAPAKLVAGAMGEAGAPVWRYYFDYVLQRREGKAKGATHGAEIIYVFNNLGVLPAARMLVKRRDAETARHMHQLWVNFAKAGTPKAQGIDWPRADEAGEPVLVISTEGIEAQSAFHDGQMSYQISSFLAGRERVNNSAGVKQ